MPWESKRCTKDHTQTIVQSLPGAFEFRATTRKRHGLTCISRPYPSDPREERQSLNCFKGSSVLAWAT